MPVNIAVRCLSIEDVMATHLTMTDVMKLVTSSFTQHGHGNVENPPKKGIHPLPDAFIHSMPAWLSETNQAGLKLVSGFNSNVAKGLPGVAGVVVLNSCETGFPIAFMDATWLTGMRTVAASLVTAQKLAPPNPKVLGIAGAGFQGRLHAVTMSQLYPTIDTVKVYEIYQPNLEKFTAELKGHSPHVKIEVCDTPEGAVRNCDLVVAATGKLLKPIFDWSWTKEGALVLLVHAQGWNADAPIKADKLVVDDWAQYCEFAGAYTLPEKPYACTGEIIADMKPARQSDSERILCVNTGLAIHDVVVASEILKRAEAKGLGQMFVLQEKELEVPIPDFD